MQQLLARHREWEGYEYFGRLAVEQPARAPLFRALQGTMQARVANEVPLLKRVAWVDDAIRKLDEGVAADPVLGRFARGLVFADFPPRFGKARPAIDDLEFSLAHGAQFPFGFERGIYRALAAAYRTLGDAQRSQEMLSRAGLDSLDDPSAPRVLGNLSVDGMRGFRFGEKRLVREAEGVYVAEGYDFSNLVFFVSPEMVVAVDAGTTEESAREAVAALRQVTRAPIKYIILTHGHWDHVGGLGRRPRARHDGHRPRRLRRGAGPLAQLPAAVPVLLRHRHHEARREARPVDRRTRDAHRGRPGSPPHPRAQRRDARRALRPGPQARPPGGGRRVHALPRGAFRRRGIARGFLGRDRIWSCSCTRTA